MTLVWFGCTLTTLIARDISKDTKLALLDCDAGRELGCKSFCCRLLIRFEEHERNEIDPKIQRTKGYVGKKEKVFPAG